MKCSLCGIVGHNKRFHGLANTGAPKSKKRRKDNIITYTADYSTSRIEVHPQHNESETRSVPIRPQWMMDIDSQILGNEPATRRSSATQSFPVPPYTAYNKETLRRNSDSVTSKANCFQAAYKEKASSKHKATMEIIRI
ncbi:uncharacterized protein LOC119370282 [Jatropha curcas]|uniref:uncharacterized protein LOC119370282 n=1 Tax=Jatropha curcas TaxID=180498 RepID=UPI0018936E43|nr:uncharacterized protein LOC119370282 [Jatropha curcas]